MSTPSILKITSIDPYLRPQFNLPTQLPLAALRAEGWEIAWNEPVPECAAWLVLDGLDTAETTRCPPQNVLLVTAEPAAYKRFDPHWLTRFPRVVSCQSRITHPGLELGHASLPWFLGRSLETLNTAPAPEKTAPLSAVCSARRSMLGHRRRLRCLRLLQRRFPGRIDWYGRKIRFIADKWDGLAPYRFSLAIENCREPDYWTEKIADCFLARTVPLYDGAPNIADYFPAESILRIDTEDPESVAAVVARVLAEPEALYARMEPALEIARQLYLTKHSFGAAVLHWCRGFVREAPASEVTLPPEPALNWFRQRATSFRRRWLGRT